MNRTGKLIWLVSILAASGFAAADDRNSDSSGLAAAITAAASDSRYPLSFDGRRFSGAAWELLLQKGRSAGFFLIGEEHGIAENPKLAGQLFETLATHGYSRLAIEVSPPMALQLDTALREGGLDGLRRLYERPGGEPAFFGMAEEAELLATVRAAVPPDQRAFWGADYEVAGDRLLLAELASARIPDAAKAAVDALVAASAQSWSRYAETGDLRGVFTFSGDPALVRAVKDGWPERDAASARILDTLEETLEINRLWTSGRRWESNQRRASLLRSNFLRHWRDTVAAGHTPKVMAKFGSNHLVRGRNTTNTFDLGSLLPELAAIDGSSSVSLMVVPGKDAMTAVLNPSTWTYEAAPGKDAYSEGIEALIDAAFADEFTLIDLAPVRAVLGARSSTASAELLRVVYGFDLLLVMSGSTPATEFEHR